MQNPMMEVQKNVVTRLIDGIGYLGFAALSVVLSIVLSIVIGYVSGSYYYSTQEEIQKRNDFVLAQAIQMDLSEFRKLDEWGRDERDGKVHYFEFIHQAKLLGLTSRTYKWSMENKERLENIARDQLGINAKFSYSSTPGYLEDYTLNQGLNLEQADSLFRLWYGYPKPVLAQYDENYRKHSEQISFVVGGGLFLLGLLVVIYVMITTWYSRKSILNRRKSILNRQVL